MHPIEPVQRSALRRPLPVRVAQGALLLAVVAWSADFLFDVFGKYRHVHPDAYTMFWDRRAWLWIHLGGGALTVLLGPVQLLTRRMRGAWPVHRWTGRLFLAGMLVASTGAVGLIATSPAPSSIRIAFAATALAWLTTALVGLVSIRSGQVQRHGAWMIRCYLVTLAPITFRAALHLPGVFSIVPPPPAGIAWLLWLSWVLPLAAYEMGRRISGVLDRLPTKLAGALSSSDP